MWIYNEPMSPPLRTVNCPAQLTREQVENYIEQRVFFAYRPEGYQGSFYLVNAVFGSDRFWREFYIPEKIYGGVLFGEAGVIWSFFDRGGEWLYAPEIKPYKWRPFTYDDSNEWRDPPMRFPMAATGEVDWYITTSKYFVWHDNLKSTEVQIQFQSEEGDMDIVTGYIGEPHITAVQDRDTNRGIFGEESYILETGSKLAPEVQSATEIRIRDGALSHQGCVGTISNGTYDALTISNGSQGMLRHDLIVARYQKDIDTNAESLTLVVIEGTPAASSPEDPAYNQGDIRDGDSPVDMPLYRVNINGVNISSVSRLVPIIGSMASVTGSLTKAETVTLNANTKLRKIGSLVVFNIDASTSAQIATGSAGQGFIVFPVGFRPPSDVTFIGRNTTGTVCEYYLSSSGNLQTLTAIPANATFRLSGSFTII